MRFAKVSLRKVRPVSVGDKFCVDKNTEVLTNQGWKFIPNISREDIIATLNPENNILEWHNPTKIYNFAHKGEMYKIENGLIDLLTTMNHKMYIKTSTNSEYELLEAKNIKGNKVWYKRDCKNNEESFDTFILKEVSLPWKNSTKTYPRKELPMNAWLKFLGLYLSEGHIDNARNVRISAHKQRVKDELDIILPELDYVPTIYPTEPDYYYIKNHQLSNYLKCFGTANNKFIPDWCKCLSQENSWALLHGLLLGDGQFNTGKGSYEYYSNSKQLADDVQLLSIMTGHTATITIKAKKGEVLSIKGNQTERTSDQYRVYISKNKVCLEPPCDYRDYKETIENDFDDNVYCLEVPNHIFMVRRNDKYCWTGNSSRSG